jgi:hypothetical protein
MGLSEKARKRTEFLSNIAILAGVVILAALLFKGYTAKSAAIPAILKPSVGMRLPLGGNAIPLHSQTLVLALRQGCHYCAESAPFYQSLLKEAPKELHFLAVLPPGNDKSYVQQLGLAIADVRLVEFKSLQINATPTLMLLDASGRVVHTWVGALSQDGEAEVRDALHINQAGISCVSCDSSKLD